MAIARSGYVAAVATNSGGVVQRMSLQAPHAPAAITMYGGEGGPLFIDSAMTSKALSEQLSAHGGFAVACNHGGGHCGAPAELHLAAWRFMKAHPFGIVESPFTDGLPPDFPTYCAVQPPSMARAR